jgi:hypothetical protein
MAASLNRFCVGWWTKESPGRRSTTRGFADGLDASAGTFWREIGVELYDRAAGRALSLEVQRVDEARHGGSPDEGSESLVRPFLGFDGLRPCFLDFVASV